MMKGVLSVNHRNNMAAINSTLHPGGQKQLERGTERQRERKRRTGRGERDRGRDRDRARERQMGRRREIKEGSLLLLYHHIHAGTRQFRSIHRRLVVMLCLSDTKKPINCQ